MDELKKAFYALVIIPLSIIWWVLSCAWSIAKWVYGLFKGKKGPTIHGDASWATDKELKKAGAFEPTGFLLCFTKSGKPVYSKLNRGALVLAGPGQGKSQLILANFRAKKRIHPTRRPHLLVHDPAGELYTHGKPILEELGYVTERIDLTRPSNGISYDLQSVLKPGTISFGGDLRSLCELAIAAEPNSRQPHFVEYARKMLQDVIALNVMFEGSKRSLPECVDELLSDKKREKMIERMKKLPYDFNAMDIFNRMSGPEGVGMMSTSLRKLDPWTMENIRLVSAAQPLPDNARGWSFEHMLNHDKPCVLFVRTGLAPGGGDFARAVFGNAVNTIRRDWDATGIPNPRGLQVFIDEAAKIGKCGALLEGHNELRKANYSQLISYVSFAAMKDAFGLDDAGTLFNGCDHVILPGNQDMVTNELYSKIIGEKTIESGSRSENNFGESTGKNEQARRLVKADEIRRAANERSFAVAGNLAIDGLKVFKEKSGKAIPRPIPR